MTPNGKSPQRSALTDNDTCRIYFQGQGPCLISKQAISKCPIVAARVAAKPFFSNSLNTIDVKEIPYDIGVVVIYFLNTGTYRILDPKLDSQDERYCSDLGTAFRVYAAATMFELTGLKNAVQNAMGNLEVMMDLPMVARSLRDTGLNLKEYPTLAMHLYTYIQMSMDVSSEEDMESIIAEYGFPESVNVDSFQSCLVSKGLPVDEEAVKATSPSKPTPASQSEPEPKPASEPPCSKDKNMVVTTVAVSTPEQEPPKTTSTKTWLSLLLKADLAKAFRRKKAISEDEDSIELHNTKKPVDEIMMPAQGLSEESMVSARKLALSSVGQESEEGDVGLQEGIFQVPPPVKDL